LCFSTGLQLIYVPIKLKKQRQLPLFWRRENPKNKRIRNFTSLKTRFISHVRRSITY
jgi:hypothetical protein